MSGSPSGTGPIGLVALLMTRQPIQRHRRALSLRCPRHALGSGPMDSSELVARLVQPNGPYADIEVVASTGSTNADLQARRDVPDRTVLIAEEQTAGEGRRGRSWVSPTGGI